MRGKDNPHFLNNIKFKIKGLWKLSAANISIPVLLFIA
jgi:hypothetical protein